MSGGRPRVVCGVCGCAVASGDERDVEHADARACVAALLDQIDDLESRHVVREQALRSHLRDVLALLEDRDARAGGGTPASQAAIRQARKELAR